MKSTKNSSGHCTSHILRRANTRAKTLTKTSYLLAHTRFENLNTEVCHHHTEAVDREVINGSIDSDAFTFQMELFMNGTF